MVKRDSMLLRKQARVKVSRRNLAGLPICKGNLTKSSPNTTRGPKQKT